MIINYSFNNYCSFYGESEYSMEAAGGKVMKRYPDNYVSVGNGYYLLKTAVIAGENAGGKSNFIGSLRYLKSFFVQNDFVKAVRSFIHFGSFLQEKEPAQRFELSIIDENNTIYDYVLEINEKGILKESLHKRSGKSGKPVLILNVDLTGNTAIIETITDNSQRTALKKTKQNLGLYVTKLALIGQDDAAAFVMWMNKQLDAEIPADRTGYDTAQQEDSIRILKDARYLDIFRMVDSSIVDIRIDDEKPFSKSTVIRKNKGGKKYERELQADSAGVRDFFSWAIQLFRVVYENRIILADEMDRVLNPILSSKVVAFINGKDHRGQFIFTTHNVLHLDLKIYMKEQIFFVTKDRDTLISELYSLADFPEVRYDITRIYEFYLKGILGGTSGE